MSPESWSFSQQGALGGGGELSPGANSTGFSSRALAFANASGQLVNAGGPQWDSTVGVLLIGSTANYGVNDALRVQDLLVDGGVLRLNNTPRYNSSALGTTAAPSSGGGAALPANPAGYLRIEYFTTGGTTAIGWFPVYATNSSAP